VQEEIAAPQPLPPVVKVLEQPTTITFHNAAAVRVGFLVAAVVMLFNTVPMPDVITITWKLVLLLAGGFLSVWLYGRRTGQALTVGSGARLGWITGVFCFIILVVYITLGLLSISSGSGGLQAFYHEAMNAQGSSPELREQFDQVLQSPPAMAVALMFGLFIFFLMTTLISAVGGALGAKVLEKE